MPDGNHSKWMRKLVWFLGALGAMAALAGTTLAQELPRQPGAAVFLGALMAFFLVFSGVMYVYTAVTLYAIAKKVNAENPWLAWIPIANVVLMLNIAKKPVWWIILCLIPLVNLVVFVIVWMGIAEARKKPSWWGVLIIVPVVNLIVPGYLAWSD